MFGEIGVFRSINDELIPRISNKIKRKVKVVLLEILLMNFILRISTESKWKNKVVLL